MPQRDYTKIDSFDIFEGKEPGRNPSLKAEAIKAVDENDIPQDLADYLPFDDGSSLIVQRIHPQKNHIFQILSGDGWDDNMLTVAANLKMVIPDNPVDDKGRRRIIDENVTSIDNEFGEDGLWKIKSWEVIANFTGSGDRDGRFIDKITWVKKSKDGQKTLKTFGSTHQWRIY